MKSLLCLPLVLLLGFVATPIASAQEGAVDMTGIGIYAGEEAIMEAAREPSAARSKAPATARSFGYVPTAALRQQAVRTTAQHLKTTNPAGAKAVESLNSGTANYSHIYQKLLAGTVYRDNDAASALAAYFERSYRVVHNLTAENAVTPAQQRGLLTQVTGLLARNRNLSTPGSVASFGEQMKLQTVVLAMAWEQARQSGQAATFRARTARQLQNDFHFDLAGLALGPQGLTTR